jgi:hypothetical protein
MADGFTPVFSPAGAGHRAGAVPDPGVDTPDDYVLRADATWGPGSASSYQFGLTGATIAAGDPDVVVTIDFINAYTVAPTMVVSSGGEQVMASFSNVTLDSFRLHLTAATPVVTDTPVTGTWLALG